MVPCTIYVMVTTCKAVWCILAVAQLIPLSKPEVLKCQWWDPKWVQSLALEFNSDR